MWTLTIDNISGIRHGTARLQPGVNAVEASNWQGKSSLITALGAALGVHGQLTEGADQGGVKLETGSGVYETELVRREEEVERQGNAYLDDERARTCAELFAVLDGTNPVRRAVRAGEDLGDLLTRPLALEDLKEEIATRRAERDRLDRELDGINQAAEELTAVEERVAGLESELESLRVERAEVSGDEREGRDVDTVRESLSDKRAARDRTQSTVECLQRQVDDLETRLDARREELDELDGPGESDVDGRLQAKRDRLDKVESKIEFLRTVFNANRRVLDDSTLLTEVEHAIEGDAVTCWVCGQTATRDAIEERMDGINDRLLELRERAADLEAEVETLEERRRAVRTRRRKQTDLEAKVRRLDSRLEERRSDLAAARDRLADLETAVEDLADRVDDTDDRRAEIESKIKYKEAELADARERREELAETVEAREEVESRRAAIANEIKRLRTRRDRIEREVREVFDRAIGDVVDTFEPGFETAHLTPQFELVVARNGREVGLNALSDGEVELLGIVAALAGYETFDAADRVPLILLDRVGGLSAENLKHLVEYLDDRTRFVVTTAYPEQSAPDWHPLSPEDWTVVSDPEEWVV